MPRDSDDDDVNEDDDTSNGASSDGSDDDTTGAGAPPDQDDAADAVRSATPEEDDAHRGMLGEVLGVLQGQGIDVNQLAQQYGLPHADVGNMSPEQLVQMTQKLAQEHPEIVSEVSQRFPMAQGLLSALTGGDAGGGLGGLLGRFL
jgi:hypothetical protein